MIAKPACQQKGQLCSKCCIDCAPLCTSFQALTGRVLDSRAAMTTRPTRYDERQGLNLGMHELNPVREGCLPVGMLPTSHVDEAGNKLVANQAPPGYLHAYSHGAGINFPMLAHAATREMQALSMDLGSETPLVVKREPSRALQRKQSWSTHVRWCAKRAERSCETCSFLSLHSIRW